MNKFSNNLKLLRKDNNISQEELAFELNVSRQAISKWESGVSYPEMDKIIQICNKFNLNIDDLLNKDIKEVKEIKNEEEYKNSINKYINDILNFISNSIDMICNMTIKTKIKCLFESVIIGVVLFLFIFIIGCILGEISSKFLDSLSIYGNLFNIIATFLFILYTIFSLILFFTILIYTFKNRYLKYYLENKDSDKNIESLSLEFKNKVIIRNSNENEYSFLNILTKLLLIFVKVIAFLIVLWFSLTLIMSISLFVFNFLIIKASLLFTGVLLLSLSVIVFSILIILLLLNFIFNRKNKKKNINNSIYIHDYLICSCFISYRNKCFKL